MKGHSLASADNLNEVHLSGGAWEHENGGTTVTLAYKDGSSRTISQPQIEKQRALMTPVVAKTKEQQIQALIAQEASSQLENYFD